jgi:hypothetical protein
MMRYTYSVEDSGDPSAGIFSFGETVEIIIHSGDPGGDEYDCFEQYMESCLSDWYDTPYVKLIKKEKISCFFSSEVGNEA